MTVQLAIERVRRFITTQPRWSKFRMAQEAGLSPNALRDLFTADWNPTADTLRKCEAVIDAYMQNLVAFREAEKEKENAEAPPE